MRFKYVTFYADDITDIKHFNVFISIFAQYIFTEVYLNIT